MPSTKSTITGAAVLVLALWPAAAAPDPSSVTFATQVKPVFEKHCLKCHGPDQQKAGRRFDSREAALKGGKLIHPGDSAGSLLMRVVSQFGGSGGKHRKGKVEPLTQDEFNVLKAWIDQGAK